MITETVDIIIAVILAVIAIVVPVYMIVTDKNTYTTPEKKNGTRKDR